MAFNKMEAGCGILSATIRILHGIQLLHLIFFPDWSSYSLKVKATLFL